MEKDVHLDCHMISIATILGEAPNSRSIYLSSNKESLWHIQTKKVLEKSLRVVVQSNSSVFWNRKKRESFTEVWSPFFETQLKHHTFPSSETCRSVEPSLNFTPSTFGTPALTQVTFVLVSSHAASHLDSFFGWVETRPPRNTWTAGFLNTEKRTSISSHTFHRRHCKSKLRTSFQWGLECYVRLLWVATLSKNEHLSHGARRPRCPSFEPWGYIPTNSLSLFDLHISDVSSIWLF